MRAFDYNRLEEYAKERNLSCVSVALIKSMATIEAVPVIRAEWRFDSGCGRVKHYRCSKCGRTVCTFGNRPLLEEFPYCNCGALMSLPSVEKPVESVEK